MKIFVSSALTKEGSKQKQESWLQIARQHSCHQKMARAGGVIVPFKSFPLV